MNDNNRNDELFTGEKSPLEALKDRIKNMQTESEEASGEDIVSGGFTVDIKEEPEESSAAVQESIFDLPADEDEEAAENPVEDAATDFVEEEAPEETQEPEGQNKTRGKISFLDRMRRFTVNEKGEDASEAQKPAYELETVDEILGIESEEEETEEDEEAGFLTEPQEDGEYKEEAVWKSEETDDGESGGEYKGFISDIDMPAAEEEIPDKPATTNTATIRFTPISDNTTNTTELKVDKSTHSFDLSGEFAEKSASDDKTIADIEEDEFSSYSPDNEINDRKDEKRFLHRFAVKKRSLFICSVLSGFLLFVIAIFLLPSVSAEFNSGSTTRLIISTSILGVIVLLNLDMFISVIKAFKGKLCFDLCASVASVSTLALSFFSIKAKENCLPTILVCSFILFIRTVSRFYKVSNLLGNLKVVAVQRPKKALTLINDDPTTLAMAKNSIEGKIMVASSRMTDRVADYMKYSEFKTNDFGKSSIIIIASLILAAASGLIAGLMKHSVTEGFYTASAILCAAAMPIAFLIDVLPLRSAATRLNRIGAMLTGYAGADRINKANAVVIKTEDIFPHGSVILKDMRVLSKNNVDDIILRAASLTDAVSSPLSNIFKQIADTNAAYDVPPSDTVKYEKRLGISGWVNDELMFIGNRTLLQAHGIEVPDLEYDRDILKKGFFPVYVAKDNKACVLLVIKYTADPAVSKQLRNAADLGITLLVDNSDPNVTNEMICDYFDLYEDSVLVMNGAGARAHRASTKPVPECSAPAAYRGNSISLLQIMSSAARVRKSNLLLTVIYVIAAVIGVVYFIYGSFLGDVSIAERGLAVLIYELAATALSLAAFMIRKP